MDLPKRPISNLSRIKRPRKERLQEDLKAAAANGGEGWVYWRDNAKADEADAITIAEGVRTQITIDGNHASSSDAELDTIIRPDAPTKALLSNGKVMPEALNDMYLIRFGFTAAMISPGLDSTEKANSIQIEYSVADQFNVHEASTLFNPDPGPTRMEYNNWNAIQGVSLITALAAPRLAVLLALLNSSVTSASQGQKFIEFGQAFAGSSVLSNGISFFVTPSVDIKLWGPDVTITRLSSPTT